MFTVDECRAEIDKAVNGAADYVQTLISDVASMAPDPGWTISRGRYMGLQPSGTTYILTLTNQISAPSVGYRDSGMAQVHVTILDGRAYYYQICEPV